MSTPPVAKKLSLREVARRFEQGDDTALEDYRVKNLNEASAQSSAALQQTLRSMPKARMVIQDLLQITKDLRGRVAGRNSDDAEQINEGLMELQAQWKCYEISTAQAARELADSAAATTSAGSQFDGIPENAIATSSGHSTVREDAGTAANSADASGTENRVSELEQRCRALELQLAKRDSEIERLQQELRARAAEAADTVASLEARISQSEATEGSQLGAEGGEPGTPARHSPPRKFPTMSALGGGGSPASDTSPSVLRTLSISGSLAVGGTLQMVNQGAGGPPPDSLQLQWLRARPGDGEPQLISGAVRHQYSPEPADVGCLVQCCVGAGVGADRVLSASGPITIVPGLEEDTAKLAAAAEAGEAATFVVVPVQHNGAVQRKRTVAMLRITPQGVSLRTGDETTDLAEAPYHADMQVCGARGGGDGAAQGLFLALSSQHVFMLALETPAKRNVCILLLRKMAARQNLMLDGPMDTNGKP
mmetsp:Transcript_9660/g.29090  ORF Transcript_9660/g.29090 Transcript_9660/m.29090 type:complete len:481 (+) Transcript_9660:260-1702(+)|eukprot:CAMPEP_0206151618 /NCGR_PEP_ID=MMETSP1473-20131121/38911_1 /ASSEMBLY_ACC=CAM_ASM_001109 /TAXON_ID=1461547 /ORGANISM="Stichococcus sp, Strain RCC1054" /LENGTH=480 /DNA_ID=CAMNT_0053549165 /DNA_START=176 /DNA_END=1618 /DNA_ORIENTATION=-